MVRSQAAAGNDAVHMHMVTEFLIPGMEHLDDPGSCAEILSAGGKLQQCLGAAPVQEAIEELLVAEDQGVQFMGEREYHMEVRCINDLCPALIHPELLVDCLAVGTAAVAAGIIMEFQMAAVRALGEISPEPSGFTVHDGMGSFLLDRGLELSGSIVFPIGEFPYPPDLQITHGTHLPSGQEG